MTEARRTPWLGLTLGYEAMVPFVLGAAGAWLLDEPLQGFALDLTVLWGGGS